MDRLGEWIITTDPVLDDGLGEFLARSVSGEWSEYRGLGQTHYLLDHAEPRTVQILPLAQTLSAFALEQNGEQWLARIVSRRFRDFSSEEQEDIAAHAWHTLHVDAERDRDRIDQATALLMGFLSEHNQLVMAGARTFLWPDIREEFEMAVDQAVDQFLADREYREYVSLLKRFVANTRSGLDLVHVVKEGSQFRIEDAHGNGVGEQMIEEMRSGINWDETLEDDLLVSVLFTLAPNEVLFHNVRPDAEAVRTIEAVFGQPIRYCSGCSRCQSGQRFSNR